jgi:hypothetical protein
MCTDAASPTNEGSEGGKATIPSWELVKVLAPLIWKTFTSYDKDQHPSGINHKNFLNFLNVVLKGTEKEKVAGN